MIAIVDYGRGNLGSVEKALGGLGMRAVVTDDPRVVAAAEAVVLPGDGAFHDAMATLERLGLLDPIRDCLASERPFLGICLGLQLLFEASDEDGATTLGVIRGRTTELLEAPTLPHIGWNQVVRRRPHPLFEGIAEDADFYFVHAYAGRPDSAVEASVVLAETVHGRPFVSAIATGPLFGVQFHPERSGTDGLRLMANFAALARVGVREAAGSAG